MSLKTESAAMLFAKLDGHPSLSNIEPKLFSTLNPGHVVEISGEAGSGKTEFLYHIIVQCIFPSIWKGLTFKGLDTGVIFFDNDYRFNLFRLINIMEKRIYHFKSLKNTGPIISDSDISNFITERLHFLHIIKCSSTEQFMITLYSLENFLTANVQISCLLIDSISAFYWIDRMNAMHQLRKLEEQNDKLIAILKKLMSNYSLTILVTKQKLIKKAEKIPPTDEHDLMGRRWQKFVTHVIELSISGVEEGKTLLNLNLTSKNEKKSGKCIIADVGFII